MEPTKKMALFIVSGASGVGKSTACNLLFQREKSYIVLESDILWRDCFDTPSDNYREYRRLWLRMAANVSQIGLPVVLCGCALPEQFEYLPEREYFSDIHYLAVVCKDDEMERRMRFGRGISDRNWIDSSIAFNSWLKNNAGKCDPPIELVDNTCLSPEKTAELIDKWINERLYLQ